MLQVEYVESDRRVESKLEQAICLFDLEPNCPVASLSIGVFCRRLHVEIGGAHNLKPANVIASVEKELHTDIGPMLCGVISKSAAGQGRAKIHAIVAISESNRSIVPRLIIESDIGSDL